MFGDLTTLTLGYRRGWDQMYRDIKTADRRVIINDPTFSERADHRGYSLALSQILTRNRIIELNYEIAHRPGLSRQPLSQDPLPVTRRGQWLHARDQVYPNTRTSNAASIT